MKNRLYKLLAVVLGTALITSCASAHPDTNGVTKVRLGSLRRDDLVVVDVKVDAGGKGSVDTNAVNGIVSEYDRTVVVPRESALQRGISDLRQMDQGLVDKTDSINNAIDELSDGLCAWLIELEDLIAENNELASEANTLASKHELWHLGRDGMFLFADDTPARLKKCAYFTSSNEQLVATIRENVPKVTMPVATSDALGCVKVGANLSIDTNGVLSADVRSIVVDDSLSGTSTNPVQNRAVSAALESKQDKLSFDLVREIPVGSYAGVSSIESRLDAVILALKAMSGGPDGRTMYFQSLQDGSTVAMHSDVNAPDVSLEYSVDDGVNWSPFIVGGTTVTLNKGKWVRIRAAEGSTNTQFAVLYSGSFRVTKFVLDGSLAVGGNSMSLFYHDYDAIAEAKAFPDNSKECNLAFLFHCEPSSTVLRDASSLVLPATNLAGHCYRRMFFGCNGLAAAPALPATTLADSCYYGMFYGCTSLAAAVKLPVSVLADSCYREMFYGCSSLSVAPELPATVLTLDCYRDMFNGCTGLTVTPAFTATTLAGGCYRNMFNGCTGLTAAPELPVTALTDYCYDGMFSGCTGLTVAPTLPATTLAAYCYSGMFRGCTGLTVAPTLPAKTLADSCYNGMFSGCTGLTVAPMLPATTLADYCYAGMFRGCTGLTAAPTLPATTLVRYCYSGMFQDCTGLTTAPELPATTLAFYCYLNMFNGCTRLSYVAADFSSFKYSGAFATLYWLSNAPGSGEFHCKSGLEISEYGNNTVPSSWTVIRDR